MKRFGLVAVALWFLAGTQDASASLNVFVDFTTDAHNGAGGAGANGTADWIDELNQATAAAGVANFSAAERMTIEANIVSHLNTMHTGYDITFHTTNPGGSFETINMGLDNASVPAGVLGFAPLDIGNQFDSDLGVTNVAAANFAFSIENFDPRASQISEISLSLAGTAGHELGHSLGLLHHMAYSNEGITPANYNATGGLQNEHIIATGSTGLGEAGRETLRELSPFSEVMYDIAGGSQAVFIGQDNSSLVGSPIISDRTENNGGDAGATLGTAQLLTQTMGETSGLDIAFVEADLDAASGDVDIFRFDVTSAGTLLAHAFSANLKYGGGAEFDTMLELLDNTGTVLASNNDVRYDGNVYNSGTVRTTDSFLNNIQIAAAGDYYLRVTGVAGEELGSNYWLVTAFDSAVPEPTSLALTLIGVCGAAGFRRRRRKKGDITA